MKRRPLRSMGGFGLYALCICLSTIALQALTAPTPTHSLFSPIDAFWNSPPQAAELSPTDLKVRNLSVHRVRYVEEQEQEDVKPPQDITTTFSDLLRPKSPHEVASVVVMWEDHPLRAKDERLEDEDGKPTQEQVQGTSFQYEVQLWVSGWGFDGLWHPANKRVKTTDPFVVLANLPLQNELKFRVRVKAKQTKRSLLGFLLPMGFFATETDGVWSDTVTLSPTRDDELEAIVQFLTGNKLLCGLLALCIGSACLVVAQLYLRRVIQRHQKPAEKKISMQEEDEEEVENIDNNKTQQEMRHEIHDLRQELADSEEEVRQLMLFSGYGIESLAAHELEQLERELKHTLRRVQHLRKHGTPELEMSRNVNVDEQRRRDRALRSKRSTRDPLPMSPIYEHRSF